MTPEISNLPGKYHWIKLCERVLRSRPTMGYCRYSQRIKSYDPRNIKLTHYRRKKKNVECLLSTLKGLSILSFHVPHGSNCVLLNTHRKKIIFGRRAWRTTSFKTY